jgi:hypothetical protein
LLDPNEGLIAYQYTSYNEVPSQDIPSDIGTSTYIYNYKTDTMILEVDLPPLGTRMDFPSIQSIMDEQYVLGLQSDGMRNSGEFVFFDWKSYERVKNPLTDIMNKIGVKIHNMIVMPEQRYLIAIVEKPEDEKGDSSSIMGTDVENLYKISWDKDYANITINDLSYMFEGWPYFPDTYDMSISPDSSWVSATIYDADAEKRFGGSNGYYKRMFFYIDETYPDGISKPVFAEGYETFTNGAVFVNHPVYGMCLALGWQEWTPLEINTVNALGISSYKDPKLLGSGILLYRMEDVSTVINLQ